MSPEAGGPAFPVDTSRNEVYEYGHQTGGHTWQFPGMSLRDYFAAHAPAAPKWWWDSFKEVWKDDLSKAAEHESQWRWLYADFMVGKRDEPKSPR